MLSAENRLPCLLAPALQEHDLRGPNTQAIEVIDRMMAVERLSGREQVVGNREFDPGRAPPRTATPSQGRQGGELHRLLSDAVAVAGGRSQSRSQGLAVDRLQAVDGHADGV